MLTLAQIDTAAPGFLLKHVGAPQMHRDVQQWAIDSEVEATSTHEPCIVTPACGTPQMAPYNTQYERLAVHLAAAGVAAEPNLWDCPVTLAREHRRATPDSDAPSAPGGFFVNALVT